MEEKDQVPRLLSCSPGMSESRSKHRRFRGQFLETICIREGIPQHLDWHQQRVDATLKHFYPIHQHSWRLEECIDVPSEFQTGLVRCRIVYDAYLFSIHYFHYTPVDIKSLQLVEVPHKFDYRYKYAERKILEELYTQRGLTGDILMTRNGWITDTTIANIAFSKKGRWYTPSMPLLAGTTWKRLVSSGILIPSPIHKSCVDQFDTLKIFNAMNAWEGAQEIPVANILH